MINDHRQWLYKNGDGRIFEVGEEIPEGYFDTPHKKVWENPPKQPTPEPVNPKDFDDYGEVVNMKKPQLIAVLRKAGVEADEGLHIATLRKMARNLK